MSTADLARLFQSPASGSLRFGQATIVAWDPATAENLVSWRGLLLRNLPTIASNRALVFEPGQTVALLGWDGTGGRGVGTWWILGHLILPGGTEDSEALFDTLSAREINVDRLNADQITVDGEPLLQFVQGVAEVTEPPPSGQLKETYTATWSANYRGNGARNTFDERPHQGFFSSTNGNQRSLIGFPTSQIQADHAGRTITRVRVYLYFSHWFNNSGGTAVLGHHGHTSPPSSFSANTDNVRSSGWPKPGGRWVTYDVGAQDWATGAKTGIALGPGPSTSRTYYGRARGFQESNPPRLEITSTA